MIKKEFEERIGKTISDDDYKVVETVYTYHPVIDNVLGKDQIAELYKIGGMRVMRDMLGSAACAMQLENDISSLRQMLSEAESLYKALKDGDVVDEKKIMGDIDK